MRDISLGWCPDIPDLREALIPNLFEKILPKRIDLRDEESEKLTDQTPRSVHMSCALSALELLDWQFRNWRGRRVDAVAEFIHQLAVKIHWGSLVVPESGQSSISLRSVLKTLKRFGSPPQHLCPRASSKWMLDRPELYGYVDRFRDIKYIRLDSPWSSPGRNLARIFHGRIFEIYFWASVAVVV